MLQLVLDSNGDFVLTYISALLARHAPLISRYHISDRGRTIVDIVTLYDDDLYHFIATVIDPLGEFGITFRKLYSVLLWMKP